MIDCSIARWLIDRLIVDCPIGDWCLVVFNQSSFDQSFLKTALVFCTLAEDAEDEGEEEAPSSSSEEVEQWWINSH